MRGSWLGRRAGIPMVLSALVLLQALSSTWGQTSTVAITTTAAAATPAPRAAPVPDECLMDVLQFANHATGFGNRTFVVALHVVPPFIMYDEKKTGNARFTGITVDLLQLLEKELVARFTFVLADPTRPETSQAPLDAVQYSYKYPEVGGAVPDFAVGAIRISANRSNALHFTLPYYDSGFQLIVRMPEQPVDPTGFFDPFHDSLWFVVCVEMMIVAMCCFYMEAPHCDPPVNDPDDLPIIPGKIFGFWDSIYWSVTIFIQTPDKAPKTWGGKVVLMAHGWFMLIVLASYTANLANFLTTANMAPTLSSWSEVQDSFGQYKIALPRGSAHESYITTQRELYGHEYNITWTKSFEDAFALVEDGVVDASFHDEPIAQQYLKSVNEKECKMAETGKMFSSFGYGFAFRFGNPDFIAFSQAIVYLKENGKLRGIIKRYGVGAETSEEATCSIESGGGDDESFHLNDMGGLLYMTAIVITFGCLINTWERWTHNMAPCPCLQPCQDCCCPQPVDIADDDEAYVAGGGNKRWRYGDDDDDFETLPSSSLSVALAEGVRRGIIEAIEKVSNEVHPPFTKGMSGIEMMENAGFVDSPRGLLGDVGAAANAVPGVGLLLGGLSSAANMVGVPGVQGPGEGDPTSPRRPYSILPKKSLSGAVSVDTSDAGSRMGAFPPTHEPKMPRAPRGLEMMDEEEEGAEETDETAVGEHRYDI